MALQSVAADWETAPAEERPHGPQCGLPLQPRGKPTRTLHTHGGHELVLDRSYGGCPSCQDGGFPPR